MGACCVKADATEEIVRKAQLAKGRDKTHRVLLLGAGESGKSTILRQATVLYGPGFDDASRHAYIEKIVYNLMAGVSTIYEASSTLNLPIEDKAANAVGKRISDQLLASQDDTRSVPKQKKITPELANDLNIFWRCPTVQTLVERSAEFQLEDTWPALMTKLEGYPVWGGNDWVPTNEDILLSRVRTTGAMETKLTIENHAFAFIDVGGQRAERKKWLNLFEGVHAVFFVASLSEYNQTLFEDTKTNRLTESLGLFRDYAGSDKFTESTLILFLNKFDLFQQKYLKKQIPIQKIAGFEDPPTYKMENGDETCPMATNWFYDLYCKQVEGKRDRTQIFGHITTALNPNNMKAVLNTCKQSILARGLAEAGLMGTANSLSI